MQRLLQYFSQKVSLVERDSPEPGTTRYLTRPYTGLSLLYSILSLLCPMPIKQGHFFGARPFLELEEKEEETKGGTIWSSRWRHARTDGIRGSSSDESFACASFLPDEPTHPVGLVRWVRYHAMKRSALLCSALLSPLRLFSF